MTVSLMLCSADTLLDRLVSGVATTQFQLGTPARELQSVLKGGLPLRKNRKKSLFAQKS
jgi:hypothetical protein